MKARPAQIIFITTNNKISVQELGGQRGEGLRRHCMDRYLFFISLTSLFLEESSTAVDPIACSNLTFEPGNPVTPAVCTCTCIIVYNIHIRCTCTCMYIHVI